MTVKCELRGRNLLVMKYVIGEIAFLGLRFGISLCLATPEPRTTAESRAKLAMKHAIGKICFFVPRPCALGSWAVRQRLLRGLSQARAEGPRSKLAMKNSIG